MLCASFKLGWGQFPPVQRQGSCCLAAELALAHLDIGALYRVVGVSVLRSEGDPADAAFAAALAAAKAKLGWAEDR